MATSTTTAQQTASGNDTPAGILIVDEREDVARAIAEHLSRAFADDADRQVHGAATSTCRAGDFQDAIGSSAFESVVLSPLRPRRNRLRPDAAFAGEVFAACSKHLIQQVVLISSAEIYGADYANPGLMSETRTIVSRRSNGIAVEWTRIESVAREWSDVSERRLSVLRPCFMLSGDRRDFASRLFRSRFAFALAGHDPVIQLLSVHDLATAVAMVTRTQVSDVFNVAPDGVIPLREACKLAGVRRVPIPCLLQRMVRSLLAPFGACWPADQIEYLRYVWTSSNEKLKRAGFRPRFSSAEALRGFDSARCQPIAQPNAASTSAESNSPAAPRALPAHDDFGMDRSYIRRCSGRQLGFMEKVFWRIEVEGLENIPRAGGALLVGIHRGFMPFDGVMMVHLMSKYLDRVPRFLIHPALIKFPHLANFLTRLGGIIACQENADHVLQREEILGVFPEGIRGAFRRYDRDIYRIGKFRDDFAAAALRHNVPIVPFVTLGPAETFPILAKLDWKWWKRHTHWPCFPITPTWPLVPFPLPTKWHIRVLPAMSTAGETDHEHGLAGALSRQVRHTLQAAVDDLLSRRKSVFAGSIFDTLRPAEVSRQIETADEGANSPFIKHPEVPL